MKKLLVWKIFTEINVNEKVVPEITSVKEYRFVGPKTVQECIEVFNTCRDCKGKIISIFSEEANYLFYGINNESL